MAKPLYTINGHACLDFTATVAEFNRIFGRWWTEGYWDGHLDVFNDILDWPHEGDPYTLRMVEFDSNEGATRAHCDGPLAAEQAGAVPAGCAGLEQVAAGAGGR